MEIDAFLCDHAEVAEGKLFVNGAGINIMWASPEPPHGISVAVAAVAQVPWTATNQPHSVTVRLEDQDNQPVHPWVPEMVDTQPNVELTTTFNVGRPPMLTVGESQPVPFAFGFNVPLESLGSYSFAILIDGTQMKRLPIRLAVMQQQGVAFRN